MGQSVTSNVSLCEANVYRNFENLALLNVTIERSGSSRVVCCTILLPADMKLTADRTGY